MSTSRPATPCLLAGGIALAIALASCAAPREAPIRRAVVAAADGHSTVIAGVAPLAPTVDSAAYTLHAFVGWSEGGGTTLPELGIVGGGGGIAGYDPATASFFMQLPGALYDSEPPIDDDDETHASPDTSTAPPVMDNRELQVPARAGDVDTLLVSAHGAGDFALIIDLYARVGSGSVRREIPHLTLRSGEVRRIPITIGAGTLVVPGADPADRK